MTDLVAQLVGALDDLIGIADVAMRSANRDGAEYDRDAELAEARAALTAAKAGGWLPIEQASDADKQRCWVLVGESVYFASYIVIGFEEKRDLDGCYIGQVDHDEYWMDIDSGDTLEPTHFQPLARPLPTPPKDPA